MIDTRTARGGIEYYDAYLPDNDSRFVFSFVRSAMDVGAAAANYVELLGAERTPHGWRARLRDGETGAETVLLDVSIVFFGRTLSGDEVQSAPLRKTVQFGR